MSDLYNGASTEKWQTLYENDSLVCYELISGRIGANISLVSTEEPLFTEPTVLRLTVDDAVLIETCEPTVWESGKYEYMAGNRYLFSPESYADDGRDYAIRGYFNAFTGLYALYFYSRYAGTYSVNLVISEPVPVTARNPAAMLTGFQLGAAIRSMRGQP